MGRRSSQRMLAKTFARLHVKVAVDHEEFAADEVGRRSLTHSLNAPTPVLTMRIYLTATRDAVGAWIDPNVCAGAGYGEGRAAPQQAPS
jgi:hypothetical protein